MALTINGVVHENGAPFLVEGVQADQVTVNGVQVWVNNYAPDAPTDLVASDDLVGSVIVTFTPSIDPGVPDCTYSLVQDGSVVATDIVSGYQHSVGGGTRTYLVRATNVAGSADSNTDSGTSYQAPTAPTGINATDSLVGSVTITFTAPSYIGVPACTYSLVENGTVVANNISSGFSRVVSGGTRSYVVRATNVAGYADSTANNGTSYQVPSAPTGMSASDTTVGSVYIYFTASSTPGTPACTYNLYENGALVASGISNGYRRYVGTGTRSYYVRAVNAAGYANSTANNGTSKAAAGSQTFTSSGTFTVPIGYTSVTICMCGAGGKGRMATSNKGSFYGGKAGTVVSQSVAVTSGGSVSVTIGAANGGSSKFGSVTAGGGASYTHAGNGAGRTTCGGTRYDGTMYTSDDKGNISYMYGGQAGAYGNGGRGWFPGANGGVGSGGGASSDGYTTSGDGGRGQCVVSWS